MQHKQQDFSSLLQVMDTICFNAIGKLFIIVCYACISFIILLKQEYLLIHHFYVSLF